MREAVLIVVGYLLGSLPWGYWLPLVLKGVDIRTVGSGNVGASNVWRSSAGSSASSRCWTSPRVRGGVARAHPRRRADRSARRHGCACRALAARLLAFEGREGGGDDRWGRTRDCTGSRPLLLRSVGPRLRRHALRLRCVDRRRDLASALRARFDASWPVLAFTIGAASRHRRSAPREHRATCARSGARARCPSFAAAGSGPVLQPVSGARGGGRATRRSRARAEPRRPCPTARRGRRGCGSSRS